MLGRPRTWLAAFAVILALAFVLYRRVPSAFIPTEDKGFFVIAIQLPDGASRQRTDAVVERVEGMLRKEPGVRTFAALVGFNLLAQANQSNGATMFVLLKDWDERDKDNTVDAILGPDQRPALRDEGRAGLRLQLPRDPGPRHHRGPGDQPPGAAGPGRARPSPARSQAVLADMNKLPETPGAATTFRANVPQVFVHVDRETAKARGVELDDLFATLQAMLSSLYINDFNLYGRTYRVQAEAQSRFRQTPGGHRPALRPLRERSEMIPLSALTRTEFRGAPSVLSRFNGFPSALVTSTAPPGRELRASSSTRSSGCCAEVRRRRAWGIAYSGQSYQERASSGQAGLVFALGLVLVFLVLAAQYESWSIPFAVILGIPFGVLGAFLGVWLRGIPSDIYFQVGLITVVGLAAKNAILIVEFANELRTRGRSVREAATEAARERFRPILMTSFAFIFGVAPLMVASGAGAASRHSLGTGVFAGMLTATTVGIFFIPLFFAVIRGLGERWAPTRPPRRRRQPAEEGA